MFAGFPDLMCNVLGVLAGIPHMEDAKANKPRTLHIRSGKPANMFEAAAWPAAFVEFF